MCLMMFLFQACTKNGEYIIPEYEEGPYVEIGAWDVNSISTPESFVECAEAGFTLLLPLGNCNFSGNARGARTFLDRAAAAGLHVFITDTKFVNNAFEGTHLHWPSDTSNVDLYKNQWAFAGMLICDEMGAYRFPYAKEKYDLFKSIFPDKIGFVNLKTMGVGPEHMEAPSYRAYAEGLMETVGPEILSYDNYAIFANGTIKENYFANLEMIRYIAKDYGAKAHNFILAISHYKGTTHYAQPTEQSLRWQIACDMTYGYDSFTYYTYSTAGDDGGWVYEPGLIGRDGKKTELYYAAQIVNQEVHKWDHVYKSFEWEGVAPILGDHGVTNWMFSYLEHPVSPDKIDGIKGITSTEDVLLGIFKDADGNRGYMATNATNIFDKKTASVTIEFNGYQGVMVYEKGEPTIIDLVKGKTTIELEPGEGKFLIPLKR